MTAPSAPGPPGPSTTGSPSGPATGRHRTPARRDRRGRGMRGRLVPPDGKLARTRAEMFDDLVLDAVEHFEDQVGDQLAGMVFAVEDVPPELPPFDPNVVEDGEVPLSRLLPAVEMGRGRKEAPRIVLYRRPLEARALDRDDLADLVHDIVLEQIANLLGVDPDAIEPE